MTTTWTMRVLTGLVTTALISTACSGGTESVEQTASSSTADSSTSMAPSTEPTDSTPTSVEATTSTSVTTTQAATESTDHQLTPEQIEECTAPGLPGMAQSTKFRFIAEEFLFECLGVETYKFNAAMEFDSDLGQEFDTIDFNSEAALIDDEPRFHSSGSVDDRPYEVTRIGDIVWTENADGSFRTLDVGGAEAFALFDEESTQAQLVLGAIGLTYIGFYGGGAIEVGTEELEGRTLTHWVAGPDELTAQVNSAGVLPVQVDVQSGSIDIWTDVNGFILRAAIELEVDDIFLNGSPALDFPGARDSGLLFDGQYELSYFDFDVPNSIEAPE